MLPTTMVAPDLLQRRLALLGALDPFRPLPPDQLARLGTEIVAISFAPGAVIVREGEDSDHFYVVVDGEVELTCRRRLVAVLGPGDYFGELALVRRAPQVATVVVRRRSSVYALDGVGFRGPGVLIEGRFDRRAPALGDSGALPRPAQLLRGVPSARSNAAPP